MSCSSPSRWPLTGGVPSLITATAPASAASSTSTMTDLGNLGYVVSLGFGIDGNGEVAGRSHLNQVFLFPCGRHTCRFTQNTRSAGATAR